MEMGHLIFEKKILTDAVSNVSVCHCSCLGGFFFLFFYHSFKQFAYLPVPSKSLYLFGRSVVYSIQGSASRTQTLKTDYCITNV